MTRTRRPRPRAAPALASDVAAGLIIVMLAAAGLPAASAEADRIHVWSWAGDDDMGDVGLRMTFDFGEANDCRFELALTRVYSGRALSSFVGRDDESIVFDVSELNENGGGRWWNHGEASRWEGWRTGTEAFSRLGITAMHNGVEIWIFAGYGTSAVNASAFASHHDVPRESFGLEIACAAPFTILATEATASLPTFGQHRLCDNTPELTSAGCRNSANASAAGRWILNGERNVVRYHRFSWGQDAGVVDVRGPSVSATSAFASGSVALDEQGLRLADGPGDYRYSLAQVNAGTGFAGGFVFPLSNAPDLDRFFGL